MPVGTVLTVIGLIASLAAKGTQAGVSASRARRQLIIDQQEAEKTAEQKREIDQQRSRSTNLGTLGSQAQKRIGATQASREGIGKGRAKTPTLGAPQAAPQAPTISAGDAAGLAGATVGGSQSSNAGPTAIQGISAVADVAGGVVSGLGQAKADQLQNSRAEEIAALRDEEFRKAKAQITRDANIQGLDFQQQSLALPSRTARENNSSTQDFASILRNLGSSQFQPTRRAA